MKNEQKMLDDLIVRCQEVAPEALELLIKIAMGELDSTPSQRLALADILKPTGLLDAHRRFWGKKEKQNTEPTFGDIRHLAGKEE